MSRSSPAVLGLGDTSPARQQLSVPSPPRPAISSRSSAGKSLVAPQPFPLMSEDEGGGRRGHSLLSRASGRPPRLARGRQRRCSHGRQFRRDAPGGRSPVRSRLPRAFQRRPRGGISVSPARRGLPSTPWPPRWPLLAVRAIRRHGRRIRPGAPRGGRRLTPSPPSYLPEVLGGLSLRFAGVARPSADVVAVPAATICWRGVILPLRS